MLLYLNIRESDGNLIHDPEEKEFGDIEEAVIEAHGAAREIMADALRSAAPLHAGRAVEITNEAGALVRRVSFESAIVW